MKYLDKYNSEVHFDKMVTMELYTYINCKKDLRRFRNELENYTDDLLEMIYDVAHILNDKFIREYPPNSKPIKITNKERKEIQECDKSFENFMMKIGLLIKDINTHLTFISEIDKTIKIESNPELSSYPSCSIQVSKNYYGTGILYLNRIMEYIANDEFEIEKELKTIDKLCNPKSSHLEEFKTLQKKYNEELGKIHDDIATFYIHIFSPVYCEHF